MIMIDLKILNLIFPKCKNKNHLDNILILFDKFKFDSDLEKIHFLTQIYHETCGLVYFKENLKYSSPSRILEVFHAHFNNLNECLQYVNNEDKLANRVYANRGGNGDELSFDGSKFKGRGAIQITFKNTYQKIANEMKIDCVNNPKLLEDEYAIETAFWFWNLNNLSFFAKKDDLASITKRVNGSLISLNERQKIYDQIKNIILKGKI